MVQFTNRISVFDRFVEAANQITFSYHVTALFSRLKQLCVVAAGFMKEYNVRII